MCNLMNTHTHRRESTAAGLRGYVQFNEYTHTHTHTRTRTRTRTCTSSGCGHMRFRVWRPASKGKQTPLRVVTASIRPREKIIHEENRYVRAMLAFIPTRTPRSLSASLPITRLRLERMKSVSALGFRCVRRADHSRSVGGGERNNGK